MNDNATMDAQSVDEFLGSETKPRWRRWMKYWLPAVVLLVLAAVFLRGGDDKQQYITEPVVERSLDIDVTATGNLRPTNQVDVGSEVRAASTAYWSTSMIGSAAGKCWRRSTPT